MNYKRMFEMDLKMLAVRADWNDAIKIFIDNMSKYEIETKNDWELYLKHRQDMLDYAWWTLRQDLKEVKEWLHL